jgi:hypothetical protein
MAAIGIVAMERISSEFAIVTTTKKKNNLDERPPGSDPAAAGAGSTPLGQSSFPLWDSLLQERWLQPQVVRMKVPKVHSTLLAYTLHSSREPAMQTQTWSKCSV